MRTNAIVRIVIFSIVILVLMSILGAGIAASQFIARWDTHFISSEGTASSTGTVNADEIRNLSIEWAAGTITIRPSDVSAITLTETCGEADDPMTWAQTGSTLKISSLQNYGFFHVGVPSKDLLIEVPWDWDCGTLEIDTAAADVIAENLTIYKVDFDGASGVFEFNGCSVDAIDIDTASGDIYFDGSLNTLDCDAASADCEIILTNHPSRIEMDMASGDLDLTLPGECGFTANLESLTGRLNSDFQVSHTDKGIVAGDGSCRIDMSAMSGNVYIHKSTEAKNCDH